jgi:hypothetical protein
VAQFGSDAKQMRARLSLSILKRVDDSVKNVRCASRNMWSPYTKKSPIQHARSPFLGSNKRKSEPEQERQSLLLLLLGKPNSHTDAQQMALCQREDRNPIAAFCLPLGCKLLFKAEPCSILSGPVVVFLCVRTLGSEVSLSKQHQAHCI